MIKKRAEHARYEAHKIKTSLDTIEKLINHMDNYEVIINRFLNKRDAMITILNKRDAMRTILSNPVFNINFTDEEMKKLKYQYELLEELLKGVE